MEPFFFYIQRFGAVPPHDALVLKHYAKKACLNPGEFFLKPGQVCHSVGFILEGVMRVYVRNEEGKEIIRGFPSENKFMIDLESFHNQNASIEYWEAITAVKFVYWEGADITLMEQKLSCWQSILLPMSQHILVSESHERTEMFNDDATARYSKFLARHPHIVARVPLRQIANYLGIAPQSLSRIRQKLAKHPIK